MDDSRFDKSIREKLGEYEAPGFDPAALASLHHQMAAISITPWYATYRTELLVGGAIALSTFLIIWAQWMFTNTSKSQLEAEMLQWKSQSEQTSQLQQELAHLKATKPDTVRIIEYQEQPSTIYLSLLRKIELLETSLKTMVDESNRKNELLLSQLNSASKGDDFANQYPVSGYSSINRVTPHNKEGQSKRAITAEFPISEDAPQRHLSAKTIKEIQKHYHSGIGIKVGPAVSFSHGSFNPGDNRYNIGGGLLADIIVSPALSLESGLMHTQRHNRIPSSDILQPANFPGSDPSLGELKTVDVDSWVFEVPLNLKYRYPITMKSNWIIGAGYTSMLYSKQILEYDYQFTGSQAASINSSIIDKKIRSYPGTLNLSLGFSSEMKNKKLFEASVYYRYGLGKVGIEQTIPEFIGLRGAYWFTLK